MQTRSDTNDNDRIHEILRTQEELLTEMLSLGEQILLGRERGLTIDQILAVMDARRSAFVRLKKVELPQSLRLADLADSADPAVREAAGRVRAQFEAVMEQDQRLRLQLQNLLGEVGDELLKIQQSLRAERVYRLENRAADGVFFDRRS
ncbi:MAG: hypothetical protein QJR06_07815 [Alicyclobacillaceae bacterium]|nr:hypothetical protein [Alicyclobacillaceae bacterium]